MIIYLVDLLIRLLYTIDMKIISITTDDKISLIDISEIKHEIPYARRIPNQCEYYYVFDDGDALGEGTSINKLCSNIIKDRVLGDVYIVKSNTDITGLAFENDCISCTEDDLIKINKMYSR